MTAPDRTFEYLLNAMMHAADSDKPSIAGYGAKRKAVFDYVAALQADAARYRWLRNTADRDDNGHPFIALDNWLCEDEDEDSVESQITTSWLQGDEADAAIDAEKGRVK